MTRCGDGTILPITLAMVAIFLLALPDSELLELAPFGQGRSASMVGAPAPHRNRTSDGYVHS